MKAFTGLTLAMAITSTLSCQEGPILVEAVPPQPSAVTWIPYWDQEEAYASFKQYHDRFSQLDLFWYRVDSAGQVTTYEHTNEAQAIMDFARDKKIDVFALVANMTDAAVEDISGWDAERIQLAIGTPEARTKHVAELVALAKKHQFDGVTIDYEEMRPDQQDSFTAFIQLLAKKLHAVDKKLAVAVYPKTSAESPNDAIAYRSQDIPALAHHADQLYIMAFGEHWEGGPPGPQASEPWLKEVLDYIIRRAEVDPARVCVELQADGIDTNLKTGAAASIRHEEVEPLRHRHQAEIRRHEKGTTPYFTYRDDNGHPHEVWYEDTASLKAKMDIARAYGVSCIGYWNIGKESPELMTAFPVLE